MAPTRSGSLRSICATWSVALGLILAGLAAAQQSAAAPPAPQAGFSGAVEVTEGLADVLVTDRDGNVILGLRPSDFVVRAGGRTLPVTGATFYSNRRLLDSARGATELGLETGAVPDQRLFVLLFDDQSSRAVESPSLMARQLRAGRDAVAWVDRKLEPGDLVAVVDFDIRLELQQDFTADRAALKDAIGRAAAGKAPPTDWPSRGERSADLPALAAQLPKGAELRDATPTIEKALTTLANAAAPIVGRKNLVMFTTGFGRLDASGTYAVERRLYEPMMQALNAADVAVYVADLTPLGTEHALDSSLSRLAEDTGGRPFFDQPDFRQPLALVSDTTNGYYLVSFRAEHPKGSSGYEPIEISVKNPEFRVTARRGYRYGNQG